MVLNDFKSLVSPKLFGSLFLKYSKKFVSTGYILQCVSFNFLSTKFSSVYCLNIIPVQLFRLYFYIFYQKWHFDYLF